MAQATKASAARRGRPFVPIAVVVILVAGGWWFLTQGPGRQLASPAGSDIVTFTGTGDQTTPSFQVRAGWQIRWENEGDRFTFAIRGDRDFGTVVDQQEPGNGVTSPTGEGTFHLEITAAGAWTVTILQGD
jgi:hypothetical protein